MATQRSNYPKEKMFYQQWWFWLILAGFILGLIALLRPSTGGGLENVIPTTASTDSSVATGTSAAPADKKEVELLNSNYYLKKDGGFIYWVAEIKNPDGNSTAYYLPKIVVTAFDDAGAVLATEEQTMMGLQPGERQIFGTVMDVHGQKPSRVDFSVESGIERVPNGDALKTSDFQIDGVTERRGEYGDLSFTGTVKNNGKTDTDMVSVVVALKQNGKVVFAENTFIDGLPAGQQKPFELSTYSELPMYDSYEVMAYNWD